MPRAGVVQRAIAAIRQFLRELGLDLELSDNDIIANFILPARGFVGRTGTSASSASQPTPLIPGAKRPFEGTDTTPEGR